jgi:hypothetical protein
MKRELQDIDSKYTFVAEEDRLSKVVGDREAIDKLRKEIGYDISVI